MIEKIKLAWQALKKGKELANVETWKVMQNAINAVAGVLFIAASFASSMGYSPDWLNGQSIDALSTAIGAAGWLFVNLYLTTATTKRIGLPGDVGDGQDDDIGQSPTREEPTDRPPVAGSGHDLF